MTAPVEPTLDAPAAEPTPATGPAPQEGAKPDPQRTTTQGEDIASLPDWAQKAIRDARSEAAKSRTTAKQSAAEEARQELTQQIAKALGLGDDEPVDPAELTSQIEHAQAVAWRNGVELQVHRLAARHGADPDALLDSNAFIDSLDDLVEDDPRSSDFATALEAKVQAALERSPKYRAAAGQAPPAAPRPDPSQGPKGPAAPTRPTSLFDAINRHITAK
jgi:hypothetical protein